VAGAVYNNRKYMLPFPDNIPHKQFWSDLPALISDGVGFTKSKVPGQKGAGGDSLQGSSYAPVTNEDFPTVSTGKDDDRDFDEC